MAAAEPKDLGTLIVVVGKARNLPNKSRFGKQDPFCTITVAQEKQKTKPIKRGGQHPEWDEELRFTIKEDVDDILEATQQGSKSKRDELPPLPPEQGVVTPQSLANISRKGVPAGSAPKKKAKKTMRVACYADDPKEPEIIGEVLVPIDDVLQQGEVDEWYELTHKDKYSGEVYLELTFYSNAAPPVKRDVPRPAVATGPVGSSRMPTSVSGMNLYIPPYGQPARVPSPSPARQPTQRQTLPTSQSFAELGLPARQSTASTLGGQPRLPHSTSYGGVDALAGGMMSMSLNPATRQEHRHSMIATPPTVAGGSALTAPVPSPHRPASVGHNRVDSGGTPVPTPPAHSSSLPPSASYTGLPVAHQTPVPSHTPQPAYQQAAYPQFQPAPTPYTPPQQQHPAYASVPSQPSQAPQPPQPAQSAPPAAALPPQFNPPYSGQSTLGTPGSAPSVPPPPRRLSQPAQSASPYPQYGSPAQPPTATPSPVPPPTGPSPVPPTPASQHNLPPPTTSGYVPWYMQTTETASPSQPPPLPPAPPKNPNGGYYPSDELFIQQQQQQQHQPPHHPQHQPQTPHVQPQVPPQQQQQPGHHGLPPLPTPPQPLYPPQQQPERSPSPQPPSRRTSVSPALPHRQNSVSPAPPPPPRPLPEPYNLPQPVSHTLNYAQQGTDFNPSQTAPGAPEGWKSTIQPSAIGTIRVAQGHGAPPPTMPGGSPARSSTMTSNRDWRNYLGSLGGGSTPQTPPQQQPAYGGSPQQHGSQPGVFGVGPPPPPPAFGTPQSQQGTPNNYAQPSYGQPNSVYSTPSHAGGSNYGTPQGTPSHPGNASYSTPPQPHQPQHQPGSYHTPSNPTRQDTVSSHSGHAHHGSGSSNPSDPFSILHAQYSAAAQTPPHGQSWYTPPPSVPSSLYQQQWNR